MVINASQQEVWDFCTDPDRMTDWLDNFERYERVTGSGKPKGGDKGKHYYKEGGREIVMDETLIEVREPAYIKLELTSPWFAMIIDNTFEKVQGGTKLIATARFTRRSWMIRLMHALQSKKKQQAMHQDQINRIKKLIEGAKK